MIYDSLLGRQLDEYRLETLLGQGGMARVYQALDARLNRWVAIKVIDKPFRADQDYTRRFEREARAIAQLEHPHIVRLYRYGETNGLLYMVLQYIEGLALDQVLAGYRQDRTFIEPAEASRIVREIGSALDYAHSKGVIHRDVKPANILLNKQGHANLVDFGLALLAETQTRGEAFGTPHYMAPEQVRSSFKVVPQSDLYALGVILYEMFTGRVPFEAEEPLDVATLHLTEPPPPPRQFRPELDPAVEKVVLRALAKEPEERYASGLALVSALNRALIASINSDSPLPTLSHLSIPERVRARLAEQPLPAFPAAPLDLPPDLVETTAVPVQFEPRPKVGRPGDGAEVKPEPGLPRPSPSGSPSQRWPVYLGVAIGLALLVSLFVGTVLMTTMFVQPQRGGAGQGEDLAPLATPTPPPLKTPSPVSEPQLVADTQGDFSSSSGSGGWTYLWSESGQNDPEAMRFEERVYGACWYAEDYVRICPTSGHPGNAEDIAWRWTSNLNGRIVVTVSARKIDAGGDGVVIIAYHNAEAVEGLRLAGDDIQGINERKFFETDVKEGDQITFVMKKNERDEYDHTAFQARIYRQ